MRLFNQFICTLIPILLVISPHALAIHENSKIKALMKNGVRVDLPILTDEWLLKLKPGQQMSDVAAQMGIGKYKKLGALKDTFVITMPNSAKNNSYMKSTLKSMRGFHVAIVFC